MASTTSKRKKAVAAGVAAAAILLAGTFAWTSISQQATNETIVDINPGGRLHDDFNGTNKDVYVENFNSADDPAAVSIFARVKLTEYMEIGQEAGVAADQASTPKKTEALGPGVYGDQTDWQTYLPGETSLDNDANVSDTYWELSWGNESHNPVYMPTFNKNKDSKEAERNGTYDGTVAGDIVHYDDYKTYTAGQEIEDVATYDHDDDTLDEVLAGTAKEAPTKDTPYDDNLYDIYRETEPHQATELTYNAKVIPMQQWIDEGKKTGPFWVYDTDGWAYWAQEIAPGETTGLLLDGITMTKVPDDNWYYGINVIGEFVTAADLAAFGTESTPPSAEAMELLGKAAGETAKLTINGPSTIAFGKTGDYSTALSMAGVEIADQPEDITLEIGNINYSGFTLEDKGADITIADGTVTVGAGVDADTTFVVTAKTTLEDGTEVTASKTVKVTEGELEYERDTSLLIVNANRSTTTEISSINAGNQVPLAVYDEAGNQISVGKWEFEPIGSGTDVTLADSSISSEGLMTIDNDANCRGVMVYAYINKGQYRGLRTELYILVLYPNLSIRASSNDYLLPGESVTMTAADFTADEVEWDVTWDNKFSDPVPENPNFTWEETASGDDVATITITHTCTTETCACAYDITVHASLAANEYYTGISTIWIYDSESVDTIHLVWNDFDGIYRENTTENPTHVLTIDASKYDGFSFTLGEGGANLLKWEIEAVEDGGEIGTTRAEFGRLYLDKSEGAKPTKFKMTGTYNRKDYGDEYSEDTQIVFDITVTYE